MPKYVFENAEAGCVREGPERRRFPQARPRSSFDARLAAAKRYDREIAEGAERQLEELVQ